MKPPEGGHPCYWTGACEPPKSFLQKSSPFGLKSARKVPRPADIRRRAAARATGTAWWYYEPPPAGLLVSVCGKRRARERPAPFYRLSNELPFFFVLRGVRADEQMLLSRIHGTPEFANRWAHAVGTLRATLVHSAGK